jgi:hypothetical protein
MECRYGVAANLSVNTENCDYNWSSPDLENKSYDFNGISDVDWHYSRNYFEHNFIKKLVVSFLQWKLLDKTYDFNRFILNNYIYLIKVSLANGIENNWCSGFEWKRRCFSPRFESRYVTFFIFLGIRSQNRIWFPTQNSTIFEQLKKCSKINCSVHHIPPLRLQKSGDFLQRILFISKRNTVEREIRMIFKCGLIFTGSIRLLCADIPWWRGTDLEWYWIRNADHDNLMWESVKSGIVVRVIYRCPVFVISWAK